MENEAKGVADLVDSNAPAPSDRIGGRSCATSCLVIIVLGVVIFASLNWYFFRDPSPRSCLLHALNLKELPDSAKINASGYESWTDYLFEADLSISPNDLDDLMAGRVFTDESGDSDNFQSHGLTEGWRIPAYKRFRIAEFWSWSDRPENLQEGGHSTSCVIWINKDRSRVLVRYLSR